MRGQKQRGKISSLAPPSKTARARSPEEAFRTRFSLAFLRNDDFPVVTPRYMSDETPLAGAGDKIIWNPGIHEFIISSGMTCRYARDVVPVQTSNIEPRNTL